MSDSPSKSPQESPYSSSNEAVRAELSEIDASIRSAALFFVISAISWLMLGTIFALLAAFKAHVPDFAGTFEFLTFGRVRSAHLNAMALGWGKTTSIGYGKGTGSVSGFPGFQSGTTYTGTITIRNIRHTFTFTY